MPPCFQAVRARVLPSLSTRSAFAIQLCERPRAAEFAGRVDCVDRSRGSFRIVRGAGEVERTRAELGVRRLKPHGLAARGLPAKDDFRLSTTRKVLPMTPRLSSKEDS